MMAIKCKCIKDYSYKYKTSNNSDWFVETIFNEGKEYLFNNKGIEFYVSTDIKYLRHIDRYNALVEEMAENVFDEHFICEKKMKTKTPVYKIYDIVKDWMNIQNDIVSRIDNNDLFNHISNIDEIRYKQAQKMLGNESIIKEEIIKNK